VNIFSYYLGRYREILILLLYIVLSFLLMTASDKALVEGIRSFSLQTIGRVEGTLANVRDYFNLYQKNQQLQQENTRLSFENFQLQEALLENLRLKRLLKFRHQFRYNLIPAKIIGYSPQEIVTGFQVLSRHLKPKHKGAAVMTVDGLVGRLVKVSGSYAICQILLDPSSKVSVRIQRNREVGVVVWDGGEGLLLKYIPNTIEVKQGDIVFTSGLSQIYPPNIKVGVVTEIKKDTSKLFQTIYVRPAVDFNALEEVFVVEMESGDHESGK